MIRLVAVHGDKAALADGVARYVAAHAKSAIAERGVFSIALAGGSTPKDAYARLAAPPLRDVIDWDAWQVFFGDERCVPQDHEDSNYRMAREALLSKVPIRENRVFRMAGEREDRDAAARDYEDALRRHVPPVAAMAAGVPVLDLVLLGIGDDGHTASIFPDVVGECRGPELVKAVAPAGKPQARLTLTYPAIHAARCVAFLAAGAGKAAIVARVRAGDAMLPASGVRPANGCLAFLIDAAASGRPLPW